MKGKYDQKIQYYVQVYGQEVLAAQKKLRKRKAEKSSERIDADTDDQHENMNAEARTGL